MQKHHDEQLTARLEQAYITGYAPISANELLYWYGLARTGKGIYRDLYRRWAALPESRRTTTNLKKGKLWFYWLDPERGLLVHDHKDLPDYARIDIDDYAEDVIEED